MQVTTRNALIIVCQQCAAIIRFTAPLVKERSVKERERERERERARERERERERDENLSI